VVGTNETAIRCKFYELEDPRELFPSVSPLVSELMNQQFEVVEVSLTNPTKETMKKYSIPLQVVQQYAQLMKTYSLKQNTQWPLELAVRFLKEKVKSDNLNFIPHVTWLIIKTRIGDKFQPVKALELMQEYLDNI